MAIVGALPVRLLNNTLADAIQVMLDFDWLVSQINANAQPIGGSGSGTVTNTGGALTANAVVIGNGGADIAVLASLGTAAQVLTSNGPGGPPSFQNASGGISRGDLEARLTLPALL